VQLVFNQRYLHFSRGEQSGEMSEGKCPRPIARRPISSSCGSNISSNIFIIVTNCRLSFKL